MGIFPKLLPDIPLHLKIIKRLKKKIPAYRRQSISRPMPIVPPVPKKILLVRQNSDFFFLVWTLDFRKWRQKRPLNGVRKRNGKTHTQTEAPTFNLKKALALSMF